MNGQITTTIIVSMCKTALIQYKSIQVVSEMYGHEGSIELFSAASASFEMIQELSTLIKAIELDDEVLGDLNVSEVILLGTIGTPNS